MPRCLRAFASSLPLVGALSLVLVSAASGRTHLQAQSVPAHAFEQPQHLRFVSKEGGYASIHVERQGERLAVVESYSSDGDRGAGSNESTALVEAHAPYRVVSLESSLLMSLRRERIRLKAEADGGHSVRLLTSGGSTWERHLPGPPPSAAMASVFFTALAFEHHAGLTLSFPSMAGFEPSRPFTVGARAPSPEEQRSEPTAHLILTLAGGVAVADVEVWVDAGSLPILLRYPAFGASADFRRFEGDEKAWEEWRLAARRKAFVAGQVGLGGAEGEEAADAEEEEVPLFDPGLSERMEDDLDMTNAGEVLKATWLLKGLHLPVPQYAWQSVAGVQGVSDLQVTTRAQDPPSAEERALVAPPQVRKWLQPTVESPADHPLIRQLAQRITIGIEDPWERVHAIVRWCALGIRYSLEDDVLSALTLMTSCIGDCTEAAALVIALCRSIGIPARPASGWVLDLGDGGPHAWAEVWMGRWIGVDATQALAPISGAYIQIGAGSDSYSEEIFYSGPLAGVSLIHDYELQARESIPWVRDREVRTVRASQPHHMALFRKGEAVGTVSASRRQAPRGQADLPWSCELRLKVQLDRPDLVSDWKRPFSHAAVLTFDADEDWIGGRIEPLAGGPIGEEPDPRFGPLEAAFSLDRWSVPGQSWWMPGDLFPVGGSATLDHFDPLTGAQQGDADEFEEEVRTLRWGGVPLEVGVLERSESAWFGDAFHQATMSFGGEILEETRSAEGVSDLRSLRIDAVQAQLAPEERTWIPGLSTRILTRRPRSHPGGGFVLSVPVEQLRTELPDAAGHAIGKEVSRGRRTVHFRPVAVPSDAEEALPRPEEVQALLDEVEPSTRPWITVLSELRWTRQHLRPTLILEDREPLLTVSMGRGDARDFARVLAMRCLASGVPARVVQGLRIFDLKGERKACMHAWVEVWCGRWIPVDPFLNEAPQSPGSLRMSIAEQALHPLHPDGIWRR